MTVSSIVPVNNYTGNSSTKIFDFDFLIENQNELVVKHKDKNGILSNLEYGIDYSINEIGNKNGSYIEFPLSGSRYGVLQPDEQLSLVLSLKIKQESEFHNSSYFNLDILEWTFDYIVRILQILNRKIDRCVKVEESISISPDEIINEIYDKYEKVNLTYSQMVEISKNVEANKDISFQLTNTTTENAKMAKEQAELAKQKAKESGLIIGEKIAIFASKLYVPECCLPCDGAEYTQSQFSDLWENYLKGEVTVSDLFVLTSGTVENGLYSGSASVTANSIYDEIIFCFQLGEDVTTYKSIGISDLSIRNGGCYIASTPLVDVTPNSKLYIKCVFEDNSTNTTYPYKIKYSCSTDNETYINADSENIDSFVLTFTNSIPIILTESYINNTPLATVEALLNTCTYSDYESDLATYGQCGKFAVDTTNGKFRVPLIKDGAVIQQALSDIELGKAYNAGLPNVTGSITVKSSSGAQTQLLTDSTSGVEKNGALYISGTRTAYGIGQSSETNSSAPKDLSFDASLSNSIYGNSDTVQMNAVALRYFVVVANGQTSQSMMDWSAWASSLQGKANIDGSNWNSSVKNVDSAFVTKVLTLSTSTAIGTYEIDLSDYLPNDGYVYEIELRGYAYRTGSSSGFCFLSSTLCPADTSENYDHFASSANGVISKGNWCRIFVGSDRKMTKIIRDEAFSACVVNAIGYRRIGTNV